MGRHRKHASRTCRIEPGSRWAWEHLIPEDDDFNATPQCHTIADPPTPESVRLGELFHNLPPDLRDKIFAQLLVRPTKWDVVHRPDCEKRQAMPPDASIRPQFKHSYFPTHTCASRMRPDTDVATQLSRLPVWRDPWASRWAPVPVNPWVCTLCWNAHLRPRPFPEPFSLPCLCARHAELQVLMVCRRWYNEAARVFYTCNTFAFAHVRECVDFFENLTPRWARLVSRVSLRVLPAKDREPPSPGNEVSVTIGGRRGLRRAWTLLAALPALSDLELDAVFLTKPETVAVLRRLGPQGLRRVRFTQSRPLDWKCRIEHRSPADWKFGVLVPRELHGNVHLAEVQNFVWPREHRRQPVDDSDFATDVARGIRGLRHGWGKNHSRHDGREVEREKERYLRRFCADGSEVVPVCAEDAREIREEGEAVR